MWIIGGYGEKRTGTHEVCMRTVRWCGSKRRAPEQGSMQCQTPLEKQIACHAKAQGAKARAMMKEGPGQSGWDGLACVVDVSSRNAGFNFQRRGSPSPTSSGSVSLSLPPHGCYRVHAAVPILRCVPRLPPLESSYISISHVARSEH